MYPVVFHPQWAPEGAVGGAVPMAAAAVVPDGLGAPAEPARGARRRRWARRGGSAVVGIGWLVALAGILVLLVPALLGFERYVIVSGSMHPLLDRGSVVFSQERAVDELEVGDVITYTPPPASGVDHLVTHRISAISHDEAGTPIFRTKGDANEGEDPWTFQLLQEEQNVMEHSVPLLGYVFIALSDPQLRMLVVGIPAALIALFALVEVVGVALDRPRWAQA